MFLTHSDIEVDEYWAASEKVLISANYGSSISGAITRTNFRPCRRPTARSAFRSMKKRRVARANQEFLMRFNGEGQHRASLQ